MKLPIKLHSHVGGDNRLTWSSHVGRKMQGFYLLIALATIALFLDKMSGGEWSLFCGAIFTAFSGSVAYEKVRGNNGP